MIQPITDYKPSELPIQRPLPETDAKTRAVALLRFVLISASIFMASASTMLSVFFSPLWMLGAIPSTALGVLGVKTAQKTKQVAEPLLQPNPAPALLPAPTIPQEVPPKIPSLQTPVAPSVEQTPTEQTPPPPPPPSEIKPPVMKSLLAPLGIPNSSNNCWINSLLHLLFDTSFSRLLRSNAANAGALYTAFRAYVADQKKVRSGESQAHVSEVSSVEARSALFDWSFNPAFIVDPVTGAYEGPITARTGTQEDAYEGLRVFLEKIGFELPVEETIATYAIANPNGPRSVSVRIGERDKVVSLELGHGPYDFHSLLGAYFSVKAPHSIDPSLENEISKRFTTKPEHLVIHLKRFYGVYNPSNAQIITTKINASVDAPPLLQLPESVCQGEPTFELQGAVLHNGDLENGHYTCIVKHGDRWIYLDDGNLPQAITDEVALASIQKYGYLLYYNPLEVQSS